MRHIAGVGREGERGEGKIGAIIGWVVFLAVAYAAWNVAPVYFANYAFKDKMTEVARMQRYRATDDTIADMLVKEANELGISQYIPKNEIRIQTTDTNRRIYVQYEREVEVLPGWTKLFVFENDVEMPLL